MSSFCLHFDNSTGVPVCLPYTLAGGTCYSSTIDAILRRVVDSVFDVFVPVFNSKGVCGCRYRKDRMSVRHHFFNLVQYTVFKTIRQCCGSVSGIRCLFEPWIRDRNRFFPGSRIPNPYFWEFNDNFLGKSSIIL